MQYNYNVILTQEKKIIIFSIYQLNIYNFIKKNNIFELQIKIKIKNEHIECRKMFFVLKNTLGYFLLNNKKVTFYIFDKNYELKKKRDLDEICLDENAFKYSHINYKELKKNNNNQNKLIISFVHWCCISYFLDLYLYSTKDLKLINQKKITSSGPFYISDNGNIYYIDSEYIYETNIEKSSDNKHLYYLGWNFLEKSSEKLNSNSNKIKAEQLIVFENNKKVFIFKRKETFSDINYVSFYNVKRSMSWLKKFLVYFIFYFLFMLLFNGIFFNNSRISLKHFFFINGITVLLMPYLTPENLEKAASLVIFLFILLIFFIPFKLLTYLYKKIFS